MFLRVLKVHENRLSFLPLEGKGREKHPTYANGTG